MHPCEARTLAAEPDLGSGDVSKCLPGWIKTLCEKFEAGEGYTLSPSAVSALAHTLIAARVRCHRLIKERDEARGRLPSEQAGESRDEDGP
jgi:hypothetical protein